MEDICEFRRQSHMAAALPSDVPRMRGLMRKYSDLPMDLTDAALVTVAEREELRAVFTVDRKDFSTYRLHGRLKLTLLP